MITGLKLLIAAGAVTAGIVSVQPHPADARATNPVATALQAEPPRPLQEQQTAPPEEPAKPKDSKPHDQQVTGTVLDRDGKAVARAEVRFTGRKKATVFTNARGEFTFKGPAGDYSVTVKAGSRQQKFDVQIADNQLTPAILVIEPEG